MTAWTEALRAWNAEKGGKYSIPRKGTKEYDEVRRIMEHKIKPTGIVKTKKTIKDEEIDKFIPAEFKRLGGNLYKALKREVIKLIKLAIKKGISQSEYGRMIDERMIDLMLDYAEKYSEEQIERAGKALMNNLRAL